MRAAEVVVEQLRHLVGRLIECQVKRQREEKIQAELKAVTKTASETVLNELTLRALLGIIARRGEDLAIKQQTEVNLTRIMAQRWVSEAWLLSCRGCQTHEGCCALARLMGVVQTIHARLEDVKTCPALGTVFDTLVNELGVPILLEELERELPAAEEELHRLEMWQTPDLTPSHPCL
jgi:hypothetical protein